MSRQLFLLRVSELGVAGQADNSLLIAAGAVEESLLIYPTKVRIPLRSSSLQMLTGHFRQQTKMKHTHPPLDFTHTASILYEILQFKR